MVYVCVKGVMDVVFFVCIVTRGAVVLLCVIWQSGWHVLFLGFCGPSCG